MFSCSEATNEMNFAAQKFARVVVGSNDVDSCNRHRPGYGRFREQVREP